MTGITSRVCFWVTKLFCGVTLPGNKSYKGIQINLLEIFPAPISQEEQFCA